ncbi:MAG TPA: glutamate formimidoyltransferase [Candidatus Polarisedimenticolaceae bacterium]|nr:glutamate formimidoyltransferase [Candidatus Polarisedimenticolaceae bacterium]
MKLIECVPNFSEGRDRAVLDAITAEIVGTEGARLLDVDMGAATHRTVVTFVGPPPAVEEAAFRAIRTAAERIDMARHRGEHPRMGATDVCPFVPLAGATMDDCVAIARRLGERVGRELGIPVYLYEAAATSPERRSLADIRAGEYEGLPLKLADPAWSPDFGPAAFHARAGATVIGAREFLIAWNVNLNTRDKRLAQRIAEELRERGRTVKDAEGRSTVKPGRFKELRGVGWYIEEYGRAQVSFNLTHHRVTPLHAVFDACREVADTLGLRVTGSELVGLAPMDALLAAGDHYLTRQGRTTGVSLNERLRMAVISLGLAELAPFDPEAKVVELRAQGERNGLGALSLHRFLDELGSDSPAPGGGSAAALSGAMAAALASMVAALTWGKKGMEGERPALRALGERAQALKDWFLAAVDRDAASFDEVLAAMRLPKKTAEEKAVREAAIQRATLSAAAVPQEVLERAVAVLELALAAAERGLAASVSDAGVAGACARTAAEGAALNVRINAASITDAAARDALLSRQAAALAQAHTLADAVRAAVEARLTPNQ